ncbi:MAG: hypothetical protein ABSA03_18880 [Streptosporangiaceae bacterium]|jgi:hypothetical protein
MPLWRIRVVLPDDPGSLTALTDVLAAQPVSRLRVIPTDGSMTGEIVAELPQDDGLGVLLGALHEISHQVFISRADEPAPAPRPVMLGQQPRPATA